MFCILSQLYRKNLNPAIYQYLTCQINTFQPTLAFHIETSHLICSVNPLQCNIPLSTDLKVYVQLIALPSLLVFIILVNVLVVS